MDNGISYNLHPNKVITNNTRFKDYFEIIFPFIDKFLNHYYVG